MKKSLLLGVLILFATTTASATFVVVLKDGTRYKATEKWTERNGQAIVKLESGTTVQFDMGLIDEAETKKVNELGFGDAKLLTVEEKRAPQKTQAQASPLGSLTTIRSQSRQPRSVPEPSTGSLDVEQSGPPMIEQDVIRKFTAAFDNVGLYDAKVEPRPGYVLRAELTANDEDDVMKALSATSYVMANLPDSRIDMVELFMVTLNGGSAGRFQMTQQHAQALSKKEMDWTTYFIQRVIF